jgi:hypothetical protein
MRRGGREELAWHTPQRKQHKAKHNKARRRSVLVVLVVVVVADGWVFGRSGGFACLAE